jgi:hypothetical protein
LEQRIAEALRKEGEWKTVVEGKIVEEVTHIRADIQEFVNKQQSG